MMFVLYLAGLAVLILALGLGFDQLQRWRARRAERRSVINREESREPRVDLKSAAGTQPASAPPLASVAGAAVSPSEPSLSVPPAAASAGGEMKEPARLAVPALPVATAAPLTASREPAASAAPLTGNAGRKTEPSSAASTAGPGAEKPEAAAPGRPRGTRGRRVRDAAVAGALALLTLIVLGSDWFFYRQLTVLQDQRAWIAPQAARNDRPPAAGRAFDVSVIYRNTGAQPAGDVVFQASPFAVPLDETASDTVEHRIKEAAERCSSLNSTSGAKVVYPGGAGAGDRTAVSIKKELIDWEFVYGVKVVVIPGCYAYRTAGAAHHSAFCFFYQHGFSNPNDWPLCQAGNYAD